ncbi:MAG: undecaprenyl-diphosphate phosphatase [Actinomycetota bacterium]|nr:undecaprenyl-diphosphate phosphatase [Actinomycetota bacterium]
MSTGIGYVDGLVLGVIEGVTEFLPISSTGHLTIAEGLLNLKTDSEQVTAFTAVVQMGAILAAVLFFRRDIIRIISAFARGAVNAEARQGFDWRLAISVIIGSVPIAVVGLALRHVVEGPLRNLWVVAAALILWSAVLVFAERGARQERHEQDITYRDALFIGLVQCFSLVPGVSRSGATISAGLVRGIDRVTATRLSFLLGIPALFAAGLLELKKAVSTHGSLGPTVLATVVSFVVAYFSIAWLLKFVSHHSIARFVPYRVAVGLLVIVLLATSVLNATG